MNLNLQFYASGSVRVRVTGADVAPRWQPTDILIDDGKQLKSFQSVDATAGSLPSALKSIDASSFQAFQFNTEEEGGSSSVLALHWSPLKVDLYTDGILQLSLNERALLHYEDAEASGKVAAAAASAPATAEAEADRHAGKTIVDYGEDGLALYSDGTKEERREHSAAVSNLAHEHATGDDYGGHKDSMPRGPRSVGLDVSFPFAQHVYGIPEHATSLALPTTTQSSAQKQAHYAEPYRLYNLDVFEYEIGNTMALYGNIPLLLAHATTKIDKPRTMTAGMFWFNPSETFVDIADGGTPETPYKQSRWLSESGEIDLFLLPGPSIPAVYRQYTALTGTQQLPPMFALGYHQCRWNYRDERDVAQVEANFEALDYPVDVIWLDIEHTDGKRYFTWDKRLFPNPEEMQRNISRHGRKMVTIVDPHIKRDNNYPVNKEANDKGLYIKTKDGSTFDGWCWPGSSSYLDFTSPSVRAWWAEQFRLDKYLGSTLDLFTWNDMNEPSVFNGPEVSMQKDAMNLENVEHREWHNLYGIYMQMATALGLTMRTPAPMSEAAAPLRPFVLTRSFWAGSQRYGAMWTGDNTAQWPHLQIAAPMLLSINLAGLSFAGADVGGFFGNPDAELFTRWYQAGAFTPFFRGHAHLDTQRREPWIFGDPYTGILRSAAMLRYSLLPMWYTVFYEAYATGMPVMRPLFMEFPEDPHTFAMDHQWMVGSALLVCPVTQAGQTATHVYLPTGVKDTATTGGGSTGRAELYTVWYDLETLEAVPAAATPGASTVVQAPLGKIPVFLRPGSIVPRKMRLRRSSKLMFYDPITLVVAPSSQAHGEQTATGLLYLDDEYSLAHELVDQYALRSFHYRVETKGGGGGAAAAVGILSCTAAPTLKGPSVRPSPIVPPAAATAAATALQQQQQQQGTYSAPNAVERVVLAGQRKPAKKATLKHSVNRGGGEEGAVASVVELQMIYDPAKKTITVKKPDVLVMDDWEIHLEF